MFALLAIIPLRAEDTFIIHGQIGAANDNWSDVITLVSDNTGKYYADRYFHPGNFGIKQLDGQTQKMWYNLDGKDDNGNQNGGETKVDVAFDALNVIDGTHQIHLNKEGAYRFVFDQQNLTVGFYDIDESTVHYCIHGQIGGNYDWEDINLTYNGNDKTWQTTKSFVSGSFGLKRLAENGEQLNWLNYTGNDDNGYPSLHNKKVDIASNQDASLSQSEQNFNLNEGGEFTFVYNPATNTLGFYQNYNPGENPDPIDPDPEDPTFVPLYLLHESMNPGDGWGGGEPQEMTYDAKTGTYSIHVNGGGAFGLSRTNLNGDANNWIFWKNDYLFRPRTTDVDGKLKSVQTSYIHFVEPEVGFYNAEHGSKPLGDDSETSVENNDNFRTHTAGTIKVRYNKTDGLAQIWYVPDAYPDLYITGAIIAQKDQTQKEVGKNDGTQQWNVIQKMTPAESNPGLYYYDLGQNSNWEPVDDGYFNLNDYIAEVNKDGDNENEIGHFNFSFAVSSSDFNENKSTNQTAFWADPFAPVGGGMGNLDRNGTPFPYVYRDSDPARDYTTGNWTSTNFVFKERCRVWVDAVRQLVWVELPNKKLSDEEVMFTFWDKRGETYPVDQYNYLRWWGTGNLSEGDYSVEVFLKDSSVDPDVLKKDAWTLSVHSSNGKTDGVYHGITANLSEAFVGEAKDMHGDDFKKYLWVRIKDVNKDHSEAERNSHVIERPYVENAIYTQAVGNNPSYNEYGDITEKEMNVTMTPDLRVIPNATEAQRMTGGFDNETTIVYPAVNQFQTVISFNDPFEIEGNNVFSKTYSIEGYVGNKKFAATDDTGTMNQIRLTGINHQDESLNEFDKIFVEISYSSPGMIFSRSYERILPEFDWDELEEQPNFELPMMNYVADGEEAYSPEGAAFGNFHPYEEGVDNHYVFDLILHKKFTFRPEMVNSRAAYIRYSVEDLMIEGRPYNGDCMLGKGMEDSFATLNGIPLVWDFDNDAVKSLNPDSWFQEAFINGQLDIELPHVLCCESENPAVLNYTITGKVVYELIVPIADEVKAYFEPSDDSVSERRSARRNLDDETFGPEVDGYVPGYEYDPDDDSKNGYEGSLTAPSDDTEDPVANRYMDVFEFEYNPNNDFTTGVDKVIPESDVLEVEYFNLQGIRMNKGNLLPGLYIRRSSDGKSSKIYVR